MELYLTADAHNGTQKFPEYSGYIAAGISCFFFGSNLLPVKQYEVGDGMLFQWIACAGIYFIGLIIYCIRGFPKFFYLPMVGGAMWATGNLFVVAIIKTIGLSLGILIWASFNMISGWACGSFGWFGLTPEIPQHPVLNYIGVSFAMLSVPINFFLMTRNPAGRPAQIEDAEPHDSDLADRREEEDEIAIVNTSPSEIQLEVTPNFLDRFSSFQKKIIGCSLSVFSGTMYGFSFVPVTYLMDHPLLYPGVSQNGLDHVFSQCSGIFIASTSYFLLYCIVKRNRPMGIPHEALFPAFISGAMWSIANTGWMLANTTISEAISFPIITTGPSMIACFWGIFYYKEIKGCRNFTLVVGAFASTITGAVLCGLSKPGSM